MDRMLKRLQLSIPKLGFIVATRAALAAGVGLLAAQRLRERQRRRVGGTLLAIGALTTIPAIMLVFRSARTAEPG